MSSEVIVALIAFAGTICGSLVGVLTSNKLVNYRIRQLEQKVDKHNNLINRMYEVEEDVALIQQNMAHYHGGK